MPGVLMRTAAAAALLVCGLSAAKLPEWYTRELPDAEFQARLVKDAAEIERVAGDSFDGDVILIEVRVRPLYGSKISLRRDDFLMRARNNNETSPAQTPDRIAGGAVLDLSAKTKSSAPDLFANDTGPIWGGAPGTGSRPRRLGGPPDQIGSSTASQEMITAKQRSAAESSGAALLQSLELPLELEDDPGAGYLYFEMSAKTKRKHLELSYDGNLGEFLIEFKKPE